MLLASTLRGRGRQHYDLADRFDASYPRLQRTDSQEMNGFGYHVYLALKKYLVCIVLLSIIVYYSLLSKEVREMDNWKSTRSIGIKASNYHLSNENYAVVDLDMYSQGFKNPIVASISETNPSIAAPTFSQKVMDQCQDVLVNPMYQIASTDMNSYFDVPNNRNYFPFSAMILVLSFFSLTITVLFDVCDAKVGVEQGRFTNHVTEGMLRNLNVVIILCLIAVLLASSGNYATVFNEDCLAAYDTNSPAIVDDNDEKNEFCGGLTNCGATIASVINPTSLIAKVYTNISFAFGIVMIIALSLKISEPRQHRRARVAIITHESIDEILEVLEEGLNSRQMRGQNADILILRNRNTNDSTIISSRLVSRINDINDRNKIISSLKTVPASDPCCSNVECSICLSQLNESKDDDVVSIKCGHLFHKKCILQWTCTGKVICPLCRADIM